MKLRRKIKRQSGRKKHSLVCWQIENAPEKKCNRITQSKEKHHSFSADANTYSNKSSAIDFPARENMCSIRKLFSKTIHCDHLSQGKSIEVKIKSHLILPDQPPLQEFVSKKVKGLKDREGKGGIDKRMGEFERKQGCKEKEMS